MTSHSNHSFCSRWIWSETESVEGFTAPQPVAREYCHPWLAPRLMAGHELVLGAFPTIAHFAAAQKDHGLLILDALSSTAKIPAVVAEGLASFGVTAAMTVQQMLEQLAKIEPMYLS